MLLGEKERMHVKILLCRCNDDDDVVEEVELLQKMMISCHHNVYGGYHRDGRTGNVSTVNFCACFVVIGAGPLDASILSIAAKSNGHTGGGIYVR